jgi:hypothetical protein
MTLLNKLLLANQDRLKQFIKCVRTLLASCFAKHWPDQDGGCAAQPNLVASDQGRQPGAQDHHPAWQCPARLRTCSKFKGTHPRGMGWGGVGGGGRATGAVQPPQDAHAGAGGSQEARRGGERPHGH